jgi:trigger factor
VQININTLSEVLQEAEILVSDTELQPHFNEAYTKERTRIEIKGFRKGKAPLAMVKRLYGETIEQNVLDSVANDFYRRAMDERSIRPIGRPSMIDMDYKRGESFRFKIQYEVRPEISLKKYKGVAVEKPVHPVSEDELDREILRLRRMNGTTEPSTSVTDEEFFVTCDVQELDPTGSPLIGRKGKDVRFYLAEETLSKDIKDTLRKAEVGGKYRAQLPKEGDQAAAEIDLIVTKIEKSIVPLFDDAFAARLTKGKVTTAEDFRSSIKTDLEKYWASWSERKLADAIIAEIVREHHFAIPESLVNSLLDSYIDDIKNRQKGGALPKDFDEEKFRSDSRGLAVWQAKWMLLKQRITEEEKIAISEAEIVALADEEAGKVGVDKERLREYYLRSDSTRERLLSRKIMEFLVAHAVVTDRIVDTPTE